VTSTLLVLQHIACEPPAAFEDELLSRGLELERVELDEGEPMPDPRDFAATIVMGRADGRLRRGNPTRRFRSRGRLFERWLERVAVCRRRPVGK